MEDELETDLMKLAVPLSDLEGEIAREGVMVVYSVTQYRMLVVTQADDGQLYFRMFRDPQHLFSSRCRLSDKVIRQNVSELRAFPEYQRTLDLIAQLPVHCKYAAQLGYKPNDPDGA